MSEAVHLVAPDQLPDLPDTPAPAAAPATAQQQFGQGGSRPDRGIPKFEVVPVRRADGSYENVEYVTVLTPGDPKALPRHKVTDRLREIYAPWYQQFRAGLEMAPSGTPLEMWPLMTPAQVQALKAVNIFTVEQLEGVADANLHRIPMGRDLKNQAKAWLTSKRETDAVEAQRRENNALRDGMRTLEDQVAALAAQLAEEEAAKPESEPKPEGLTPAPYKTSQSKAKPAAKKTATK